MNGENVLRLCPAEVMRIVQEHLRECGGEYFASVKVNGVVEANGWFVFDIKKESEQ